MNCTVRVLTPADAAQAQALRLRALVEEPTSFASSVDEEQARAASEVAQRLMESDLRVVFGAFRGPRLVGTAVVTREARAKLRHKAWIQGVYVAREERKAGVGRALLEAALARAFAWEGVRQVNLGVNAANQAAIVLYERMGFETFGRERAYMIVEGVAQDELHMVRVKANDE